MPLVRIDMIEGRSPEQIKALLDAAHRALLAAFKVPARDRYQIVHARAPSQVVMEDTGLGIARTRDVVLFQINTHPHEREAKERFYKAAVPQLEVSCGLPSSEVVVSIVTNTDEEWSFGQGRAQFLNGELAMEGSAS